MRQEPKVSSVSVIESIDGPMERRLTLVVLAFDAVRDGTGLYAEDGVDIKAVVGVCGTF